MEMITCEHIKQAFFRLECQNLYDPMMNKNSDKDREIIRRKRYAEWSDLFANNVECDVWQSAVDIAVRVSKAWPNPAQMCDYVDAAMRKYEKAIADERKRQEAAAEKNTKFIQVNTTDIMAAAKAGEFKKYKDLLITPELLAFTTRKWPDVDMEFVNDNLLRIKAIMDQECYCSKCMNPRFCRTNGYRNVGKIDKYNGWLYDHMEPCPAKGTSQ